MDINVLALYIEELRRVKKLAIFYLGCIFGGLFSYAAVGFASLKISYGIALCIGIMTSFIIFEIGYVIRIKHLKKIIKGEEDNVI